MVLIVALLVSRQIVADLGLTWMLGGCSLVANEIIPLKGAFYEYSFFSLDRGAERNALRC